MSDALVGGHDTEPPTPSHEMRLDEGTASTLDAWIRSMSRPAPTTVGRLPSHSPTCAGCGNRLYSSKTKFESSTGWPSFWAPLPDRLVTRTDFNVSSFVVDACGIAGEWAIIWPDARTGKPHTKDQPPRRSIGPSSLPPNICT
mgnify:CR=1 FL=1